MAELENQVPMFTCDRCEVEQEVTYNGIIDNSFQVFAETLGLSSSGRQDWCRSCRDRSSYYCNECEKRYSTNFDHTFVQGDAYCEDCVGERFSYCEDCEEYGCDCNDRPRNIHDYSYKPHAVFHGLAWENPYTPQPYMGIELEIENRGTTSTSDLAGWWNSKLGEESEFYLKYDGSLSNGFEIVSHPRTMGSWRESESRFTSLLDELSDKGARSWNTRTCGLHIHVSRNSFRSPFHLSVFTMLFTRNKYDWQRIAGRESGYARFERLDKNSVKMVKGELSADHFDAINLGGYETVEIRIWKPSLRFGRVMADLEFVESARLYTENLTSHDVLNGALNFFAYSSTLSAINYPNARRVLDGFTFNTPQEV